MNPLVSDPGDRAQAGARTDMIVAALCASLRQRWASGERLRVESLLAQEGEEQLDESAMVDLLYAESLLRREFGEEVSFEEYRSRFPLHAPALKRQWEFDAMMDAASFDVEGVETELAAPSLQNRSPVACPGQWGRYHLVAPLGSGGQADVFRAVHPDLGQEVVLKISRSSVSPESVRGTRILSEARTLAALSHPNIPRVFDAGIEQGYPYLVVEYVRGRTLAETVRSATLPVSTALQLVAQLARAASAAHSRGIVHLDIKPGNIVIDDAGESKLIDFGLARWRSPLIAESADNVSLSGTLQFMAPEQARGESERIGESSDVYALGGILLFALTGQEPRRGSSFAEVLEKAQNGEWDRSLLSRFPVPNQVRRLCEDSLQTDLEKRVSTAEEFAVRADAAIPKQRTLSWILAIGGVAVLALIAFLVRGGRESPGRMQLAPVTAGKLPASQRPSSDSTLQIEVWEDNRFLNLADVAPVRTGDLIRVRARVSAEMHSGLFLVTSEGKVRQLSVGVPASSEQLLEFPETGKAVPLTGPTGTEFVFFCASRESPVLLDDIEALWGHSVKWPPLQRLTILSMEQNSVVVEQADRDFGESVDRPDPESEVHRQIDAFRQKLRSRYDLVCGFAFAHAKK